MFFATREGARCRPHLELSKKKLKRRSWRYLRSPVLSLFSTNKNTKFVKTTIYTKLFTRRRRKPDKHSTDQESLSRQRSTSTGLFTWHRRKPDKHPTDQESLSRQRSTYTELFTRHKRKPEKHSTDEESLSRQWFTKAELFMRQRNIDKEDINEK